MKFKKAWDYLYNHKKFQDKRGFDGFLRALYIYVVLVNPKTLEIDDDEKENTKVQVWLECGAYYKKDPNTGTDGWYHDIRLDCGADTFEEAIIKLAKRVKKYHL